MLIPPKDFRDESVSSLKNMLEKWGIEVVLASYSKKECVGSHGAVYSKFLNAGHIKSADYDAIILIDGAGIESYKLYDFRPLLETVSSFANTGKMIVGINNGIKIMARANVVSDIRVAAPNNQAIKDMIRLYHGKLSENYLEDQRNIVTLSDPERIDRLSDLLLHRLGAK
jgi:putative intracellular protease/amidase